MATTPPADDLPRQLRELVASGRFREALELHQRAEGTAAGRPEAQLLAATAATRVGNLGAAESLAAEAHEGFRGRADHDGRMRALNLLGAIAFEHGHLSKAEQHFHQVMLLARELDDQLMVARVANNLGSVAIYQQPHHVALSLYRSALLASSGWATGAAPPRPITTSASSSGKCRSGTTPPMPAAKLSGTPDWWVSRR
ncbi:MAG: tetratricopeptide repeat protein [Gemmatimonadota bacterium]|nr:tetratricopeptide repeat protein [Gemmatimonadota bacterium]